MVATPEQIIRQFKNKIDLQDKLDKLLSSIDELTHKKDEMKKNQVEEL